MTEQSKTPRTDALAKRYNKFGDYPWAELCRELETENADLRRQVADANTGKLAAIQKQPIPEWARKDGAFTLYGAVTTADGKRLAQVQRPVTFREYTEIDTIIGFYMTDALGCEYGYGMFFGRAK